MYAPFVFSSIQPYLQLQSFFLFKVHMGRCPSPTLLWFMPHFSHCYKPSPLQAYWGRWCHTCLLWLACLFTVHIRGCLFTPLWWKFHTTAAVTSFPLSKVAGWVLPLLPSPAGLFIYSSSGECSSPTLQSSGCPALFATCLFFQLLVYYSVWVFFLFFP
jgi:hypothetical protein